MIAKVPSTAKNVFCFAMKRAVPRDFGISLKKWRPFVRRRSRELSTQSMAAKILKARAS